MKLAVLATSDPLNLQTWSGTPYFMTKALQRKFPNLLAVRTPRAAWLSYLRRIVRRASVGRIDIFWNQSLAELSAKRLVEELKSQRV